VNFGLGGGDAARYSPGRLGRQRRGLFEERGGGGQAAVRDGAVGRAFELGGNRLVRAHRRAGTVPGPPVGVGVRVRRLGECLVNGAPLAGCGGSVGGRAEERVPEPDPVAQLQQAGLLRRRRVLACHAQPFRRVAQQCAVSDRFGGRQQQQSP
jgi:hypothetical protein